MHNLFLTKYNQGKIEQMDIFERQMALFLDNKKTGQAARLIVGYL